MTLKELIDKLPAEIQDRVRQELNTVINLPLEAAQRFIGFYQNGDTKAAYKVLVLHMTGTELDAAMEATNARMKLLKQRVSNEKARVKSFVDFIIQGLMSALAAWVQSQEI